MRERDVPKKLSKTLTLKPNGGNVTSEVIIQCENCEKKNTTTGDEIICTCGNEARTLDGWKKYVSERQENGAGTKEMARLMGLLLSIASKEEWDKETANVK
ncbi:unnamed protein product [marine sediment metagenome]|uniref:Uncharacterized protein n=1 Tax=marine sediment metagenome TaxID=412755 RepID=X1KBB7_9ZZZZ